MNIFLNDRFTYFFSEALIWGNKFTRSTTIADFMTLFPESLIEADIDIKNTHVFKKNDQIYLHEYLPLDKNDVLFGKGADKNLD